MRIRLGDPSDALHIKPSFQNRSINCHKVLILKRFKTTVVHEFQHRDSTKEMSFGTWILHSVYDGEVDPNLISASDDVMLGSVFTEQQPVDRSSQRLIHELHYIILNSMYGSFR
jgi:hypothetical protein